MHYWKDKRFYWATSYAAGWNTQLSSSWDGPQTGKPAASLRCSHELHFKPSWDPDADPGLSKYTFFQFFTISYLPKKGWWKYFFSMLPDVLTALFIRHDYRWLVLLWCGVTYSCYYKYSPLIKPSVLQLCTCVTTEHQNWGLHEEQSWHPHPIWASRWISPTETAATHSIFYHSPSLCVYFTLITKTSQHKVLCYLCIYLNIYNYFLFCKN